MGYHIHLVPPDGPLTQQITTVNVGEKYDLVVTVQDFREDGQGVFAGYLDISYDSSKAKVQAPEIQKVKIGPFPTDNFVATGTFTLTIPFATGNETTTPITYSSDASTLATAIQNALQNLPKIGGTGGLNLMVTADFSDATHRQFNVRFQKFLGQDVPNMTVASQILTGATNPVVSVTYDGDLQGGVVPPLSFREAFRARVLPGVNPIVYFSNALSAIDLPNRLDEVGAISSLQASGTNVVELVRARFQAIAAGTVTFSPDLTNMVGTGSHCTLVFGFPPTCLNLADMDPGTSKTLTIAEAGGVSAVADGATVLEDSDFSVIDVLANDTTTPATGQTKNVVSVTQPANGTVSFTATNVSYKPAANFAGIDTFVYEARNITAGATSQTSTATVTVTVSAINDAPSFTIGPNQNFTDESGPQSIAAWATAISAGPGESGQTLEFIVASDNCCLFSEQPEIDSSGRLTFTPRVNASGTTQVGVVLRDNGGKEAGGIDESLAQIFTITITKERPGHNVDLPLDSSGDGKVSSIDALLCVNFLNRYGTIDVPDDSPFFVDTNGDGKVSALDLLLIFNQLNRQQPAGEGESPSLDDATNVGAAENSDDLIGLLSFDAAEQHLRRRRAW